MWFVFTGKLGKTENHNKKKTDCKLETLVSLKQRFLVFTSTNAVISINKHAYVLNEYSTTTRKSVGVRTQNTKDPFFVSLKSSFFY